jgi:hypothetical protein
MHGANNALVAGSGIWGRIVRVKMAGPSRLMSVKTTTPPIGQCTHAIYVSDFDGMDLHDAHASIV